MQRSIKRHYQPTAHFTKKLRNLEKNDPDGFNRIQNTIERLLAEPSDADGKMVGLYHGRLKKYVGRRDYRIIYYWCELCHKENRKQEKKKHCNDTIPDNSVIFFDVYHKKDKKKFKKNVSTS